MWGASFGLCCLPRLSCCSLEPVTQPFDGRQPGSTAAGLLGAQMVSTSPPRCVPVCPASLGPYCPAQLWPALPALYRTCTRTRTPALSGVQLPSCRCRLEHPGTHTRHSHAGPRCSKVLHPLRGVGDHEMHIQKGARVLAQALDYGGTQRQIGHEMAVLAQGIGGWVGTWVCGRGRSLWDGVGFT